METKGSMDPETHHGADQPPCFNPCKLKTLIKPQTLNRRKPYNPNPKGPKDPIIGYSGL